KFSEFLQMLADDQKAALDFYHERMEESLSEKGCSLTMDDVKRYKVVERKPVKIDYHGKTVELASPPSAGGVLIAHALKLVENKNIGKLEHNSAEHIRVLAETMSETDSERTPEFFKNLLYADGFWRKFLKRPDRLGGTTHVSVIDSEGSSAAITTSNGEGAGVMVKGTGIMFNNFAAEPDLMQYRDIYRPGHRIITMMSPTAISQDGRLEAVLGSGGNNRIRSAIFQVISNMLDFRMPPQKATDASRVHYEAGVLQLEHGIKPAVMKELAKEYKTNPWRMKNLFFGGVHVAAPTAAGGDRRRGGSTIVE
ncbi:TPA: gamma-glutamyltransferase, partial [Candidatus Micrarchaeota archaeon]|nr:gamma-glutamyltransferase [Candidatus Micrarchaeota archaeon]